MFAIISATVKQGSVCRALKPVPGQEPSAVSGGRHCHCHRRLDLGSVTGHFPIRSPFQPGTRRLRPKQQVASPPSPAGRDHRAVLAGTRPAAGSGPALDATGGVSGSVGGCGQRGDTTHLGSALSLSGGPAGATSGPRWWPRAARQSLRPSGQDAGGSSRAGWDSRSDSRTSQQA